VDSLNHLDAKRGANEVVVMKNQIRQILKRSGIEEGQTVIDFGCGAGEYALPAAEIVGPAGRVYAIDRDGEKLRELAGHVADRDFDNVVCEQPTGRKRMRFGAETADVCLLFDVLHRYYFPSAVERKAVLCDVHRVLKSAALLLVHPTHIEETVIVGEVEHSGFRLRGKRCGTLIHDGKTQKSCILIFQKTEAASDARGA